MDFQNEPQTKVFLRFSNPKFNQMVNDPWIWEENY